MLDVCSPRAPSRGVPPALAQLADSSGPSASSSAAFLRSFAFARRARLFPPLFGQRIVRCAADQSSQIGFGFTVAQKQEACFDQGTGTAHDGAILYIRARDTKTGEAKVAYRRMFVCPGNSRYRDYWNYIGLRKTSVSDKRLKFKRHFSGPVPGYPRHLRRAAWG